MFAILFFKPTHVHIAVVPPIREPSLVLFLIRVSPIWRAAVLSISSLVMIIFLIGKVITGVLLHPLTAHTPDLSITLASMNCVGPESIVLTFYIVPQTRTLSVKVTGPKVSKGNSIGTKLYGQKFCTFQPILKLNFLLQRYLGIPNL